MSPAPPDPDTGTPLITIVIPTYRRPDILGELMDALLPQMPGTPVEILVIDNCPDASARDQIAALGADMPALQYAHEPQSGVVHARNHGVRAARGTYILFLDDDEVPSPGWLAGFLIHAHAGVVMASGRILPRYEAEPDPGLADLVFRLFSRDYPDPDGADITRHHIELGTGNALFHKARCFPESPAFDLRFNRTGGEDIWMIKRLISEGEAIVWAREGLVAEVVPASRMTGRYLAQRRFNQGQLRCMFLWLSTRPVDRLQVPLWMGVGAAQAAVHGMRAGFAALSGSATHARHRAGAMGGLGKLLWWRGAGPALYADQD